MINKVRVLDEPRMSPYPYLSFIYINQPYLFNAVARGMKEKRGRGKGCVAYSDMSGMWVDFGCGWVRYK